MISSNNEPGPGQKGLEVLLKGLGGLEGKVGWGPDAVYEDGTPVAYVATINEFGSPKNSIPPRSFARTTMSEKAGEWGKAAEAGARAVVQGAAPVEVVFEKLVAMAEGDIRKKITQLSAPPLSPLTLLVRKYKRGLVKGFPPGSTVSGKTLGMLWGMYQRGEIDTSGVNAKPLVDSGIMLATLTSQVVKK